jgi:DNA-binding response OmpR family regulator
MTRARLVLRLAITDGALHENWRRLLRQGGWNAVPATPADLNVLPFQPDGLVIADMPWFGGTASGLAHLKTAIGRRPLLLTSRTALPDSVVAEFLEAGADDYVLESLDERLRLAKIRSHTRRLAAQDAPSADSATSPNGDLRVDLALRAVEVFAGNDSWERLTRLTPIECRLMRVLLHYAGTALDRQFIAETVWKERAADVFPATVDKHVESLRRKLGTWSSRVRTVYGGGYGYIEENVL